MKHIVLGPTFAALGLVAAGLAIAEPLSYELRDEMTEFRNAPGVEFARSNCLVCHSADYIATQPPKMGNSFWEAEVIKMKHVYGAPIDDSDIKKITEYLATAY